MICVPLKLANFAIYKQKTSVSEVGHSMKSLLVLPTTYCIFHKILWTIPSNFTTRHGTQGLFNPLPHGAPPSGDFKFALRIPFPGYFVTFISDRKFGSVGTYFT